VPIAILTPALTALRKFCRFRHSGAFLERVVRHPTLLAVLEAALDG